MIRTPFKNVNSPRSIYKFSTISKELLIFPLTFLNTAAKLICLRYIFYLVFPCLKPTVIPYSLELCCLTLTPLASCGHLNLNFN